MTPIERRLCIKILAGFSYSLRGCVSLQCYVDIMLIDVLIIATPNFLFSIYKYTVQYR